MMAPTPHIGKPLQMIDQVLAGEALLGHHPFGEILKTEMAMHIDQRRHHRLAGEIDARGAGRQRHLALTADAGELRAGDEEG